jgi:hypothetical protein
MKFFATLGSLAIGLLLLSAGEPSSTNESEAAQWQRIYERLRTEEGITNAEEMMKIPIFRASVVHPSFGLSWDEVPAPTITNSNAMASVNAFVVTNGWNMETNGWRVMDFSDHRKPIRGLPWEAIKDREFGALTHGGVLYVLLKGWHHNLSGVAYNPRTNSFAPGIRGFKPLGDHWYVWTQPEDPITLPQTYEGQKSGEQGGPTNGSQPIRLETNRTSSAAGSRQ